MTSSMPHLGPSAIISYGLSHNGSLAYLNIWSIVLMHCIVKASCLKSSFVFMMTFMSFQVLRFAKGEFFFTRYLCSFDVSRKIS